MDIWSKIKGLFEEAENSSPSHPLIHELIERTEEEKADYNYWKERLVRRQLCDWIYNQYAIFQTLPRDTDSAIDFLNHTSSKGFVVHFYKMKYSLTDGTHLFDYLKERTLELDYKAQISDRRVYNRPHWVEKVEKHFLKPRINYADKDKFKQQFGNILIELVFRNDKIHQLKFSATGYNDRAFERVQGFKELIQKIL